MKRADDGFGRLMDQLAREGDFKHWRLTIKRTGDETQTHVVFGRGDGESEVCLTFLEAGGETACRTRILAGPEADNDDVRGDGRRSDRSGPGSSPVELPRARSRQGE